MQRDIFKSRESCLQAGHGQFRILVRFLLGNSPAAEFYLPTFRNILFDVHRQVGKNMEQSVPKRWHIKLRRRGITQKKAYNTQNTAKV